MEQCKMLINDKYSVKYSNGVMQNVDKCYSVYSSNGVMQNADK